MSRGVFSLALRLLSREWRSGELGVLLAAVLVAVAAVTTVGFFTDRVKRALELEANRFLGADLVLVSDHPPPAAYRKEAERRGLTASQTLGFPSMASANGMSRLAEIKVVEDGYPLRGKLALANRNGVEEETDAIPPPGAVWAEGQLLARLGLKPGGSVEVGATRLRVDAVLAREPDRAGNLFSFGPRLMMNAADLPATGLMQEGSRVSYRLLLAGEPQAIETYRAWAQQRLGRGERLEGVRDARPEIRNALERARQFLGLSGLVAAVLASVAAALAARRYVRRHLDACALLRTLGASQASLLRLHLVQLLLLGLAASLGGALIGLAAQWVLASWLGPLVSPSPLPPPSFAPFAQGLLTGVALLLGFAMPPMLQLRAVPALRVLRRELGPPARGAVLSYLAGAAVLCGLFLWQAGDAKIAFIVLAGLGGVSLAAWLLVALAALRLGNAAAWGGAWRFGIANLRRRGGASAWQVAAFGLGLMALLTLTVVRGGLMNDWRATLPPDAPNRFIINIQPDQQVPLRAFFISQGSTPPELYPMVRGRLQAIGGKSVSAAAYADERAQRLVEREFNLSWTDAAATRNVLVAGRWPQPGEHAITVEDGLAKTLGIHPGDELAFDIGGMPFSAKVTGLRKVEWDTFRVNFFVLAPPGVLEDYPASYVTALYLPPAQEGLMNRLAREFPNLTVIDVAAVMDEVRGLMERVARAVQFVFLFTLLAGLAVLYAAVVATRDERAAEAALLRVLGAQERQILRAQIAEFAAIGLLSGLLASLGSSAVGWALSTRVFHVPFHFNGWLWVIGLAAGSLGVSAAGWLAVRRVVGRPVRGAMGEA